MPRYEHPISKDAPKRQFIAGAICPSCKAQDTTVQVTTVDDEWAECVSCNHVERRPTAEYIQEKNAQLDGQGVVKFKL